FMAAYWQATEHLHVRRGSTVRVRQRALQKACTAAAYRAEPLAPSSTCGGYGALYGAFRSKTSSAARAESPLSQLSRRKVADLMVAFGTTIGLRFVSADPEERSYIERVGSVESQNRGFCRL